MRKVVGLLVVLLCFSTAAMAQDTPKGEFSAGFSYVRINPGSSLPGVNLSGWYASLAGNVNDWFGVVGEFSGHYGKPANLGTDAHTYLFGPRISYRKNEKLTPFVHVLMGAARAGAGPGTGTTAFAMAMGGGVDARVTDGIAIRAVQFDYVMTRFFEQAQHNIRLSAGITFRFAR
jgi:opacity protein-like surface antigen